MASQYKVIYRLEVADSPVQAVTGKSGIRMAVLISGSAASTLAIRDEVAANPAAPTTDPIAELKVTSNNMISLHFDNAEGRLPIADGILLTLTGTGAVAYIYGS